MDLVGMNKFANNLAVPILMIAHTDGADLGQVGIGQTEEGRAMARCPAPENHPRFFVAMIFGGLEMMDAAAIGRIGIGEGDEGPRKTGFVRSEEHTSELQSLMRLSYSVFCLNKTTYTPRYP